MNNNQYCVIMAGGFGNFFWPITRESKPKQFIDLLDAGMTFLRATYDHCVGLVPKENILIISHVRFKDTIKDLIPEIDDKNVLLEPYSKKTGPCVAYATYEILRRNPNAVIAMIPVDIIVRDTAKFQENLSSILNYAAKHPVLMTIGVVPTHPDSNYGYIQVTNGRETLSEKPAKVKTFTEKPPLALAEVFCKSGEFFWNTGIFVWQGSVIREEMERYIPEVTHLFNGWEYALGSQDERRFLERTYTDCSKISIDYGVMEKTERVWMYLAQFDWGDVDTWGSFYHHYIEKDADGNICNVDKKLLEGNSNSIMISNKKKKLLAINGLENYIVVDTDDVLLICPRNNEKYKDFITNIGLPPYEEFR